MIHSSFSIGEKFSKKYSSVANSFSENEKLHILTDKPHYFANCLTYNYNQNPMSYMDKIIFAVELSVKNKEDVLYYDIDSPIIRDKLIHKIQSDKVLIPWLWLDWPYSTYESLELLFVHDWLGDFLWDKLDYYPIPNIHEEVLFFPYSDKSESLLSDLKYVKPLWENSLLKTVKDVQSKGKPITKYHKYGIGSSEGFALSVCLIKNDIQFEEYKFFKKNLM